MSARKIEFTSEDVLFRRLARIHLLSEQNSFSDSYASVFRGAANLHYHLKKARLQLEQGDRQGMATSFIEARKLYDSIKELEESDNKLGLFFNGIVAYRNFPVSSACEANFADLIDYCSNFSGGRK